MKLVLLLFIISDCFQPSIALSELDPRGKGKFNATASGSRQLTLHLLSQHNRDAPPDGFISVHHEVELVNIQQVDEVAQTITVLLYIEEKWRDPSLSWDPDDFGGLNTTWLPEERVWLPDIIIFNMLSHEDLLHSVRAPVMIRWDGTVLYSHPAVYTVMCAIDISWFPLDGQHCPLEIASWDYEKSKLELEPGRGHTTDHYHHNEEWELVGVDIRSMEYHHEDFLVSEIYFDIFIHRKPFFYMFSLVLPSFIITTLSIVGLFAPFSSTGERQEKFTLGVTAILTMAVLSLMVSEKVPHTSKNIPLLVGHIMTDMLMITFATGLTSLVLRVHRKGVRGDPPAPRWLCLLLFVKRQSSRYNSDGSAMTDSKIHNAKVKDVSSDELKNQSDLQKMTIEMVRNVADALRGIREELSSLRGQQEEGGGSVPKRFVQSHLVGAEPTWIKIAHNVDLLLMAVFLGVTLSLTGRMLILSATMTLSQEEMAVRNLTKF